MPLDDILESNSIKKTTEQTPKKEYKKMPSTTTAMTAKEAKEANKGWLLEWLIPDDLDIESYLKRKAKEALRNVVGPRIRDMLIDSLGTVLGKGGSSSSPQTRTINRVSYESKYSSVGSGYQKIGEPSRPQQSVRNSIYEDIGFDSPDEADDFMKAVEDLFDDQDGFITILQFYSIANRPTSDVQDNYGWLSLNAMKRVYDHGRYYVSMSNPVPLNDRYK